MIVLGIDLCTSEGSISLIKNGELLGISLWNQPKKHSEKIFVEVRKLLEQTEIKKEDISLVVVSSGPGAFTGVRLSVTVGKSLKVLGLKVKAVSTLQLIGLQHLKANLPVISLLPGRRNRYYTLVRKSPLDSSSAMDLTEEEFFSKVEDYSRYIVVYKGNISDSIKENFKTIYETTPLSLIAALIPFEFPQLLKPLHFYYVRDHDAKPSCKKL
ncbi:tRNA (adenosine(37)-N6)-threonylcarbamoyltransferase complex dimerization subunit type 1 TsaB [Desulfurobacterium thermolithotrophum]|uniref:tRNA (adenosine(37)-N6)-threonylcarbamoyltransferase complex dimerization subunit type 1 TsaB n=1 Tax=Desulfurobacterium thermolithotrophum TaxID=64160 RepID=UPI0013D61F53|nr:tRNA (adenosine(37)-N6)-threonylcarbamoyltransferase complex dimerization subunit type 1 TsaB [Desulfurobacterium thermolithotrophum]